MKFSTRVDTDLSADDLFASISNFDALERMLIAQGVTMARLDPGCVPNVGSGWMMGFDWRGKPRRMRLAVARFDRPERMELQGQSEALDLDVLVTVVALGHGRSRLIFETEIRPRTMKARLMVQTAKLGKAQMDRRYQRRTIEFLRHLRMQGD